MADPIIDVVEPLLVAADRALGTGYSAVLYGSAARGDYLPGASDINLLLVLDDVGPAALRSLSPAFLDWRTRTPEPPLLVSREEWARATDVFPIEITDMQASHRVLRGADPLAGLIVSRADLRRGLESELRGKLLRLRQGFTLLADRPGDLGMLARSSVPTALVLFRCLLTLGGKSVAAADRDGIIRAAAALAGFAPGAPLEVARNRGDANWRCPPQLFEDYLDTIVRTARHVDQLHPGDAS
ncbi:MAG TPA: nucleotidyltransferase domain-containing protein [Gemmatimonadales bacterium]|nr:nucleotidyltransferase domain-containing protein [Gemmatimonadales bacterium]